MLKTLGAFIMNIISLTMTYEDMRRFKYLGFWKKLRIIGRAIFVIGFATCFFGGILIRILIIPLALLDELLGGHLGLLDLITTDAEKPGDLYDPFPDRDKDNKNWGLP